MREEQIEIHTDYIKLDAFLKFVGEAGTGGEAKIKIAEGGVTVNGEVCLQRGKKLHGGDKVALNGKTFVLIQA